jgi:hypothetical protein
MTPAIIQTLLTLFAGLGLFLLWRRIASSSRTIGWIVTGGFLARAIGGLGAFLVSYLRLPIGRSLQLGNGLWIFSLDGSSYFDAAAAAARGGPAAIVYLDKTTPSVFFVQTLATALLLFGSVVSAAILLNLFAYLLCCGAIVRLGDLQRRAVLFALAAVSLAPSAIMWSLQPLKDTLFVFLVTLFFAASAAWQRFSGRGRHAARHMAVTTVVLAATIYAISGIRWYFGVLLAVASGVFVLLTLLRTNRRVAVAAAGAALLPLLAVGVFIGSGPYLPDAIRLVILGRLKPSRAGGQIVNALDQSHDAFNKAHANTTIEAGAAIRHIDRGLGAREERVELSAAAAQAMPGTVERERSFTERDENSAPGQDRKNTRAAENETATSTQENDSEATQLPMTSASQLPPDRVEPVQRSTSGGASAVLVSAAEKVPANTHASQNAVQTARDATTPATSMTQPKSDSQSKPTAEASQQPPIRQSANAQSANAQSANAQSSSKETTAVQKQATAATRPKPAATIAAVAAEPDGGKSTSPQQSSSVRPPSPTPAKPLTASADSAEPREQHATRGASSEELRADPRPSGVHRAGKTAQRPKGPASDRVAAPAPAAAAQAKPVQTNAAPRTNGVSPPPAPLPAAPKETLKPAAETVSVPSSALARLVAGTAAMILPRQIASALGVVNIHGGHGLWFIVEVDTLAFDAVLLFAIVSIVGAFRRPRFVAPVFWMILIVTGAMAVILVYTVSNFGTLFRHREMILLGLALLPIAALQVSGSAAEIVRGDGAATQAWRVSPAVAGAESGERRSNASSLAP